jgi:2-dehydro-3-deoxyphosphooctonate aldolase (KDO 8-P synthase)
MSSTPTRPIKVTISEKITVGDGAPLLLFAGPCQIESLEHCLMIADHLQAAVDGLPISLVFKSSFDKANRTSLSGKRGLGLDEGLKILDEVKRRTGLCTITDVHLPDQTSTVASVVDVLQIPAFLCRQTDLIIAAAETMKPLHIKKGQFVHPEDMRHVLDKATTTGNKNLLLCERGTMHGYRDLVVDYRSLPLMRDLGYPVVFDATHSVQSMSGNNGSSGGCREFIPAYVRAAVAVGVDGLFLECHEAPEKAPSDGPSMLRLHEMRPLLTTACAIRAALDSSKL